MQSQNLTMEHLIVLIIFLSSQSCSRGQDFGRFIAKHKEVIENYIMAGYGSGWSECDLMAVSPQKNDKLFNVPGFVMSMAYLKAFDISRELSDSHCLLLTAHVENSTLLADLIEFGWTAVHHRRLGMALRLGTNLTLDMATNTTNLPFLIAAQLERGRAQFLCPRIGGHMPHLLDVIPHPTYSGKPIRIGHMLLPPFSYVGVDGRPHGVDIEFINLLKRKMHFKVIFIKPSSYGVNMVIGTLFDEHLVSIKIN